MTSNPSYHSPQKQQYTIASQDMRSENFQLSKHTSLERILFTVTNKVKTTLTASQQPIQHRPQPVAVMAPGEAKRADAGSAAQGTAQVGILL